MSYTLKTDLDPSQYDIGSGLSCSYDKINYYLKGVIFRKGETGLVEATTPDSKWIRHLFTVNFKITTTLTTTNNIEKKLFGAFYKTTNNVYGECHYNAQRKFVSSILL